MPQRYPPWVIKNIVAYLKLKLGRQFPTFSCHNEKQEYETQLTDNYPRLYIFASVAEPLGSSISCKLGPDKHIEMEVLIRDRRTSRLFIKLALKSYKDFDLVINCMHQSICNYLTNDPHKLSCSSPSMQAWTPVWSPPQNIEADEKYISPELYASYFERDGGYTINSDIKIHYDEKDDGSTDYNNIQDPYLKIEQIPKPDDKAVPKLTDAEDKQRRADIVKAVEGIWEKLSKEKYPGAEKPTINNLLGGTLIAKKSPLRIIWVKYSFKKIHDYLISLGQQDSQDEMEAAKPSVSIHSSSAEFDATTYSRPRKAQRQLHAYPTYSHLAQKQETPRKPSDPFFLYLSPTPEDAEDVKEELSVPAIKPVNKSGLLQKELKPSAPPAPPVKSSLIPSPTLDGDVEKPIRLTRALSKKTSQSEIPHSLGNPDLPSLKRASDKANTTEQKSVAFSATTKTATPQTNPTHVAGKSPAPPIKTTPMIAQLHTSQLKPAPVIAISPSLPLKAPPAVSKQPTPQLKSSQAMATPPAPPIKASPIIAKQPVNTAKPSAPKASPALKEVAKPAIPINDSDSLVARLAAKALSPPIIKPKGAPSKPSALKSKQPGETQSATAYNPAAYIPVKSVSFSKTLATVDALIADNKKRKQGAAVGSKDKDATVESQETLKSKPVATESKSTALASKATPHSNAAAREPKNVALIAKDLERGNPVINLEQVTTRSANKRAATANDGSLNKDSKRKRDAPVDAATPESDSSVRYPSRKR